MSLVLWQNQLLRARGQAEFRKLYMPTLRTRAHTYARTYIIMYNIHTNWTNSTACRPNTCHSIETTSDMFSTSRYDIVHCPWFVGSIMYVYSIKFCSFLVDNYFVAYLYNKNARLPHCPVLRSHVPPTGQIVQIGSNQVRNWSHYKHVLFEIQIYKLSIIIDPL